MAIAAEDLQHELRREAQRRLEMLEQNRQRYDVDFPLFAQDCLTIRPKDGNLQLFRFNTVQRLLHYKLEQQIKRTGMVRAIVLKARQPGVSTYSTARYYHHVSRRPGRRAFILTHQDDATENVFAMVKRFHDNNPHAPETGKSNAKELYFPDLDSGFAVGTAGSKGVGRSFTFQYFHGSEVAFWPNAESHVDGSIQAVPRIAGSEIILESTANGIGGLFYNMTTAAMRGKNEYQLVFIPWFVHTEYTAEPPPHWDVPPEFADYALKHNLTLEQLYWAFLKNSEFASARGTDPNVLAAKFKQEYPTSAMEAFRSSREGGFIDPDLVDRARNTTVYDQSHAPVVFGCDFATGGDAPTEGKRKGQGEGGDSNYFIDRQGRQAGKRLNERFKEKDSVQVAIRLAGYIDKFQPEAVFMDAGGGGAQVFDMLRAKNYRNLHLVQFGGSPSDPRKYRNKRAEMWGNMRDWLKDDGGADIPDDDSLDGDLTAPWSKSDFNNVVTLASKDQIRKEFGFSPDGGDALGLTFAAPVRRRPVFTGAAAQSTNIGDHRAAY